MVRFRTALTGEFRSWEEFSLAGFQVTCLPKAAFWSLKLPPRVLGRLVRMKPPAAPRRNTLEWL